MVFRRSVTQSKGHNIPLEQSISGAEISRLARSGGQFDLLVARREVQRTEPFGSRESVQCVLDAR